MPKIFNYYKTLPYDISTYHFKDEDKDLERYEKLAKALNEFYGSNTYFNVGRIKPNKTTCISSGLGVYHKSERLQLIIRDDYIEMRQRHHKTFGAGYDYTDWTIHDSIDLIRLDTDDEI